MYNMGIRTSLRERERDEVLSAWGGGGFYNLKISF